MPAACWCSWWRQRTGDAEKNKLAMQNLVCSGTEPGLLAYDRSGVAVGWVSVGPRDKFGQLMRSRAYRPQSDEPGVWSIVCFFVDPTFKRKGVAGALLDGVLAHARRRGAKVLEAYPNVRPDYMGHPAAFAERGFQESREAGKRRIVRLDLG